jgi:hypothetical protein
MVVDDIKDAIDIRNMEDVAIADRPEACSGVHLLEPAFRKQRHYVRLRLAEKSEYACKRDTNPCRSIVKFVEELVECFFQEISIE